MEAWFGRGSPQGQGNGSSRLGKSCLVYTLLEVTINPTIEPADPRVESPQAKQLTGREHSPTYWQIIGLKFY